MGRAIDYFVLACCVILLGLVVWGFFGGFQTTSRVATRLFIVERLAANCSFLVYGGWNLIGLSCEPANNTPQYLIAVSQDRIVSIHSYFPGENDSWKVYNPSLPAWVVQDLSLLDRRAGYWVYAKEAGWVNLNGTLTTPTLISLVRGWNLIGYPQLELRNISQGLSPLSGNYSIVYARNNSAGQWLAFVPGQPWETQGLKWLEPHHAIWINMSSSGVWYVD